MFILLYLHTIFCAFSHGPLVERWSYCAERLADKVTNQLTMFSVYDSVDLQRWTLSAVRRCPPCPLPGTVRRVRCPALSAVSAARHCPALSAVSAVRHCPPVTLGQENTAVFCRRADSGGRRTGVCCRQGRGTFRAPVRRVPLCRGGAAVRPGSVSAGSRRRALRPPIVRLMKLN